MKHYIMWHQKFYNESKQDQLKLTCNIEMIIVEIINQQSEWWKLYM